MKVKQISLFLENVEGQLYRVSSLLGENGINIRAITIGESEGVGILRIIVNRPDNAVTVLKQNGFVAQLADVVALEVDDKPGGLVPILKVLSENKLNIEYLYGFIEKFCNKALVAVRFDDPDEAVRILNENGIRTIT